MIPEGYGKVIGYYGFPKRELIRRAREEHGSSVPVIDLDLDHGAPDSGLVPSTTCAIITNIIDNSAMLGERLAVIVAAVGEDKCDRGRHAAFLLSKMGFNVVESRISGQEGEEPPLIWSVGEGMLAAKIERIMDTVTDPEGRTRGAPNPCRPTHGFWGVPPNDFRILELFPPTTHIYGWTRCVEAGRPADLELECQVDDGVPTVFFTQSFCAKQELAQQLARRYGGIEVDCHREINDSILAKVEAFLKLS